MKSVIALSFLLLLPLQGSVQSVNAAVDLYEHGKFLQASEILSGLVQKDPLNAEFHVWLGRSFLKLRRWDDAILHFSKAVELDPKNGMCHLWLGRAYGRKADHVSFFSAYGLAKKVRSEFEAAVQLAPDNTEVRFDLLEFYMEAPGIVGGGKDKAEAQALEIARISPRLGYSARAALLEKDKEFDRARDQLVQETAKYPKDAGAFADLAKFLLRRSMFQQAETAAQKAVELDGTSREARMYLAAIQTELRTNPGGALKILKELSAGPLTDNDPGFEEVYYWLGRAFLTQEQKAEARKAFETSLRYDPEYSPAKDALKQIRQ